MSQAHKGELLALRKQLIPLSKDTTFFANFDFDLDAFSQDQKISPLGFEKAMYFDGTGNNYATSAPTSAVVTGSFTWEAWIYPTNVIVDQMFIGHILGGSNYFRLLGSKIYTSFNIGGSQRTLSGVTSLVNDTWYHVAAVYDGAAITLYLNGVSDATLAVTGSINTSTPGYYFGIWVPADKRPFKGQLSDVRMWNYARTQKQIKDNMNTEFTGNEFGLLGYWKFNQTEDSMIYDSSVYGNDAVMVGTPTWGEGRTVATLNPFGKFGRAVAVEENTTNLGLSGAGGLSGLTYTYVGEEDGWKKYSISGTWNAGTYPYSFTLGAYSFAKGIPYSVSCHIRTNVPQKFAGKVGQLNVVNDSAMTGTQAVVRNDTYTSRRDFIHSVAMSNNVYVISQPIANGTVFNATTDFMYVKDVHLEQKSFSTSYVDGSRSNGRLAYPANVLNKNEGTINMWVSPSDRLRAMVSGTGVGEGDRPFIYPINSWSSSTQSFLLYINDGIQLFCIFAGTSLSGPTNLAWVPFEWHMITLKWSSSGNYIKIFLDGVEKATAAFVSTWTPGDFTIGHINSNFFFDEVRIDKVAISDDEITTWYQSDAPFYNDLDTIGKV